MRTFLPSGFMLKVAEFLKNVQAFLENYGKKLTFLNVHLLCKKHFIDCFFVLSVVFEKCLEKWAVFG